MTSNSGRRASNQDSLDLIKRDLILAPVVKPGGVGTFMIRHLLGDFKSSANAKALGDAGGPEGVAADAGSSTFFDSHLGK